MEKVQTVSRGGPMVPVNRISLVLVMITVLMALLILFGLPGPLHWVETTPGVPGFIAWLIQFASAYGFLFRNLFMVILALLVFDRTVGFRAGFYQEFREYWRRVPDVFGFLVMFVGLLALIQNLDAILLFLLSKLDLASNVLPLYKDHVSNTLESLLGFSPTTLNAVFLTVFTFSLIVGYIKTPSWKLARLTEVAAEYTLSGSITTIEDPEVQAKRRQAERYLEKGRMIKAAKIFEEMGGKYHYRAAKIYNEKGQDKSAAQAFGKAGNFYIQHANYLRAGDAYFLGGFWWKAAEAYEKFKPTKGILENKQHLNHWIGHWGEALFHIQRYKEAAVLYEKYGLYRRAGEAYEKAGMMREAAELYNRVGAFDSSSKAFQSSGEQALALIQKAKHLSQNGDYAQAGALYEEAMEFRLAAQAYGLAKMNRKAALCYQRAGDRAAAAEMYISAGEPEEALTCYQDMEEYEKAAQLAAHLGFQDKQAVFYEKAGQLLPAARSFLIIGDTARAVDCLKRVSLGNVAAVDDCLQILTVLLDQNRLTEALAAARSMIEGETLSKLAAPILVKMAQIQDRMGHGEIAASTAIRATKLVPDNADLLAFARNLAHKAGVPFTRANVTEEQASTAPSPEPPKGPPPTPQPPVTPAPTPKAAVKARPSTPKFPIENDDANVDITQTLDDQSVYDLTEAGPLTRYRIVRELGRGGMGRVYKAWDRKLNRPVALKMLQPELNSEPKILLFFKREVHAVAGLNHPNIVSLYDAGMEKGCFYMIMEFVDGYTLDILGKRNPDTIWRSLTWIWHQVCQGLKFAHEQGIIHRDIKPTNIMVSKNRGVKLLDFGLAKQVTDSSKTRQIWGTPAFMAPELFYGKRADFQTDIYGLGATLYLLAAQRSPYYGNEPSKKFVGDGLPVAPHELNPNISRQISDTIQNCLLLDRAKRYQTVADLMRDVKLCGPGIEV